MVQNDIWKCESPKYWKLPDDGAPMKCDECQKRTRGDLYLVQTPNGTRSTMHLDCIEPEWLETAKYLGDYPND